MQCGLFGKLPSKRDFIVHNVPRAFLTVWEGWLQSSIAASRVQLGTGWQPAFLTAPIWRFWIGSQLCGTTVAGVMMPSVDGVGRYFPLTLCACAPEGMTINPPHLVPMDSWYEPAEAALLRALQENFKGEPNELLQDLAFPPLASNHLNSRAPQASGPEISVWKISQDEIVLTFDDLLAQDIQKACGSRSYWWTLGGENYPARIAVCNGLPDPYGFTGFLTGAFDDRAAT